MQIFRTEKELEKIVKKIEEFHDKRLELSKALDEQKKQNEGILSFIKGKNEQQKNLEEKIKSFEDKIIS